MTLIDDIWKLSSGLPTKSRIGSRGVPHRLRNDEEAMIKRSLLHGYLEVYDSTRSNVVNIYLKLCEAARNNPILIHHLRDKSFVEYQGKRTVFSTRQEAKNFVRKSLT